MDPVARQGAAGSPCFPLSVFIIAQNEADRIGDDDPRRAAPHGRSRRRRFRFDGRDAGRRRGARRAGDPQSLARLRAAEALRRGAMPAQLAPEPRCGRGVPRRTWRRRSRPSSPNGEPDRDAYRIRIAEMFPGEEAPHPLAYALAPVRLYRKDRGRYSPSLVHDRVDLAPGARVRTPQGDHPPQLGALARRPDRQAQPLLRPAGGGSRDPRRHDPDLAPFLRVPGGLPQGLYRPPAHACAAPTGSSPR